MNHPKTPVYYTVSTVCPYDGSTTVLAICEDMDAVMYRLKQCYTTCGDEYMINCYHLTTADEACKKYNEQLVSRRKYEQDQKEKEKKVKYYDEVLEEADEEIKTMSFDEFEAKENENWESDT